MQRQAVVLTFALVTVLSGLLATRMGSEFIPNLNEGDFAIQALRIPGTSLTQSVAMQQQLETTLKAKFPEIERVFARTGTAEIASDPMPPNISDGYIMLKPRRSGPSRAARDELLPSRQKWQQPGNNYEFSQPIQLRFNELISGAQRRGRQGLRRRHDGAERDAGQIAAMLQKIAGASEVKVEQTTGLPMLTVQIDRDKTARYGLNVGMCRTRWPPPSAAGGRHAVRGRPPLRHRGAPARCAAVRPGGASAPADCAAARRGREDELHPAGEVASLDLRPAQPGQPRERQAPHRGQRQRARARHRLLRRRGPARLAEVKMPAGYWTSWGGSSRTCSRPPSA
jgi:cobalt-zinc-cadmium resistance protein CzcA